MTPGEVIQPPPYNITHPGYVAGRWYQPPMTSIGLGVALVTNTIRLGVMRFVKPITLSDLAVRISTASAAGNIQLALYAMNEATKDPTGNALASTGSLSTTSTGLVSADISGTDVRVVPGFYYTAINSDNSTVVVSGVSVGTTNTSAYRGSETLANICGAPNASTLCLTVAQAFNTWPDLTSASFTETTGYTDPLMLFKVSGVG